jgi:hypothetical protein
VVCPVVVSAIDDSHNYHDHIRIPRYCSSRCRLPLSPYYSLGSLQRRLHTPYPSHSPLHRYREMVEMTWRWIHGNGDGADKAKSPTGAVQLENANTMTMGCRTPNRTRTLVLIGSPEDTHIRMVMTAMTTAGG